MIDQSEILSHSQLQFITVFFGGAHMIDQSELLSHSQLQFITLFFGGAHMIDQSEILSHCQLQFITLFFGGAHPCLHALYQPRAPCTNLGAEKTNFLSETGTF